ncbi:unnamed protein product [Caenorhabditis brenneri]
MDAVLLFWLFSGTISVALTIFLILLLSSQKVFSYSFYRLVLVGLILNLLCWINTWPHRLMFRSEGEKFILPIFSIVPGLIRMSCGVFCQTFFHIQSLCIIFTCVHRLTSSMFKNANQLWNQYYLFLYGAITMISLFVANQFTYRKLDFDYETRKFVSTPLPPDEYNIGDRWILIFITFYFTTILILSLCTFIAIRKRLKNHSQYENVRRRLTQITLANAVIYLIVLLWKLARSYIPYTYSIDVLMTVSDLVTFSMSYMMVLFDKNVQKVMKHCARVVPRLVDPGAVSSSRNSVIGNLRY